MFTARKPEIRTLCRSEMASNIFSPTWSLLRPDAAGGIIASSSRVDLFRQTGTCVMTFEVRM